jgi:aspartate/methionine/tyrosine aminotransferase
MNVILSIINPGDEAIILAPYWVSYRDQIILAGGKPVVVEGLIENAIKRVEGASKERELKKRGEALHQRLHEVGAQREPILVIIGKK